MRKPKQASNDGALVELFLDMQAAERGAGENTLAAYRNDLDDLTAHLRGVGRTIAKADTDDLRGFLKSLDERGFAASSLARRLSATRQLYRFLYAEGKRSDDPAAVLEGPKRALTLPKILSIAEVDSLLTQARSQCREHRATAGLRACARRGCCACWKSSMPPACASRNWWRCRFPLRGAIRTCWSFSARATRNGWCR